MDQNSCPVFLEIKVPTVSGLSVAEASERIAMAGFVEGGDLSRFSEWIASWSVQRTDPMAGEPLCEGAVVNLVLRANDSPKEPPPFDGTVPFDSKVLDVGGLDVDAAAMMLQSLGYTTSFVTFADEQIPEPVVTGTRPSAGTFLPPPANVQINVSVGPL